MWMGEANSHGEEPESRAEAEREGSELKNLPFEGHPEESPVHILQIDERANLMDTNFILKRLGFKILL